MSVRINLLPEARIQSLHNKQLRRLVTIVSIVICASVGIILLVLLLLLGARNIQYAANAATIKRVDGELEAKRWIDQDLAWFNEALNQGAKLNDNRILISQLFDYLAKAVPDGVTLIDISVDKDYVVKASVKARDYANVALLLKALETYNVDYGFIPGFERKQVFTDIDLATVAKGRQAGGADFEISFKVDQDLVTKFRKDNASSQASPTSNPSANRETQ